MITGNVLQHNGWQPGKALGLAKAAAAALADSNSSLDRDHILAALDRVRQNPGAYLDDPIFGPLAVELEQADRERQRHDEVPELRDNPLAYRVWGAEAIDKGAIDQMNAAMRLPVTVAGALMPDAHIGYGLPIGGVLATGNAVIPYAVGVDIACRMRLSLYEESPDELDRHPDRYTRALNGKTYFGAGAKNEDRPDHDVLHDERWNSNRLLRGLKGRAETQLGTSGSGNHFVEWGSVELHDATNPFGLAPGRYLALLSHSGSRGVGFKIANTYSKLAMDIHPKLDPSVRHLAWLSLDEDAGQEYWLAMELAGRFASANHEVIHHAVARAAGLQERATVENHHNFAWREQVPGENGEVVDAIVHRKGATPAGSGVLGVIPGSMGDPGFIVRGKGLPASLQSAAHGAGRLRSRRAAIENISRSDRDAYLRERGVTLLGGGIDESPQAYKRIEEIIAFQTDLVDIVGEFRPKIVRMADEPGDT
jgi:tRNA-splicing ligase RtcB (3'-phosphate/5'-hydroxy nucleic acid ligase)